MAKLPTPGLHGGEWGDILNDYLRHQHRDDGSHDVAAILNVPEASGQLLSSDPSAASGVRWQPYRTSITLPLLQPSVGGVVAWRAPAAARLVAVHGYRVGGNGATVNVQRLGGGVHLATDLSISTVHSWLDGGHLQDAVYAAGDTLLVVVAGLAGAPAQLTVQIDVEYL